MKAVVGTRQHHQTRPSVAGNQASCRTMASRIDFHGEKFILSQEMKECFQQLIDMVPGVPRNHEGNIDGTVLIQYVIDYILDLELQLDGPANSPSSDHQPSWQCRLATDTSAREPLSEKSIENTASIQIATHRRPSCLEDSVIKGMDTDAQPHL